MNLLAQPPLFWEGFVLVLCRVGAVLMIAPIFGHRSVPAQVRVALAVLLSLVMLPTAAGARGALPPLPESLVTWTGLIARELLIGSVIGFAVLLVFLAIQGAGHAAGLQIGFSLANIVNPLTAEHSSLVDQFYTQLAVLVFLAMDGHHALLIALQQTFDLVPLAGGGLRAQPGGPDLLGLGLDPLAARGAWPAVLNLGGEVFLLAARIALPVMAALLLADVALAIVARAVPQLNVFVIGIPAKLGLGLIMLLVTVPVTAQVMARAFAALGPILALALRG
jgi:flagellar biosynthetic protein FliR